MTLPSKKILHATLKNSAIVCATATLLVSSAAPAHAYYNFGYGMGSLLWPVRALFYPLAATPWSYRSPAYLASTTAQAAARNAYRGVPQNNVYGNSLNYTEDQASQNNGQNSGLLQVPQGATDQISYARWNKPTDAADRELLARAPGAPASPAVQDGQNVGQFGGQQSNDSQPIGVPFNYGGQPSYATNGSLGPMPAPPMSKHKKSKQPKQSNQDYYQAQQSQQPQSQFAAPVNFAQPQNLVPQHLSSPLAAHFIETVNGRFGGDIAKALRHSETRNLAEAMGLVDRQGFSVNGLGQDRIETISRIFKDPSLDPSSKLDAMKILLRSSSAPATAQSADRSF